MTSEKQENKSNKGAPRWYALSLEDITNKLSSDSSQGLSESEASKRLKNQGPNRFDTGKQTTWLNVLLDQVKSPLVYVLIVALLVTLAIGHRADAIVIGIVVLLNTVIGFFQEYRAEQSMEALLSMVTPRAEVLRDGSMIEVDSEKIVPGDIVRLGEGRIIPADVRLTESHTLQVDESSLTGESNVVSKEVSTLDEQGDLSPSDQTNMAFMSTHVRSGHGKGIVVATGHDTEIGGIAKSLEQTEETRSPLQQRIDRFARWIAYGILGFAGLVFLGGIALGQPLDEMFLTSVALAVAAMPEGLPVVVSIALAVGVKRMSEHNAVVRRLPAVETLGSTTTILTDKTGTLTQNKMSVQEIYDGQGIYRRSEQKEREFVDESEESVHEPSAELRRLIVSSLLNNEARYRSDEGESPSGDPMEVALLALEDELSISEDLQEYEIKDQIPFSSNIQFSSYLFSAPERESVLFVKGAPEVVFDMCQENEGGVSGQDSSFDRESVSEKAEQMARHGLRVLAFAEGHGDHEFTQLRENKVGANLKLLGLIGFLDPPREEVAKAVEQCHSSGIRVIMCTGDHRETAYAIARMTEVIESDSTKEIDEDLVLDGRSLNDLSEEELAERLKKVRVFARVRSEQKLRIVDRLKETNEIVAVTGDGVNDAPALKSAHLGVAMGQAGTDVAKQSSDMILTDDNFSTIFEAVKQGRTAFRNIRMATFFLISAGVAEVIAISGSLVVGWPLLILPSQILWLNVVTNGIIDIALAFEPEDENLAKQKPRPPGEGLMSRNLIERTVLLGLVISLFTLGMFYYEYFMQEQSLSYSRVSAMTLMVVFQIIHVFNCRSENESVFSKPVWSNWVLVWGTLGSFLVHLGALYVPLLQDLLRFEPLQARSWLFIWASSVVVIMANEAHKKFRSG